MTFAACPFIASSPAVPAAGTGACAAARAGLVGTGKITTIKKTT
jgi:hypothetical protein